jgi:hypothetical protein
MAVPENSVHTVNAVQIEYFLVAVQVDIANCLTDISENCYTYIILVCMSQV